MDQSEITQAILKDLKEEIERLQKLKSNIEVVWNLKKMHYSNRLMQDAEIILRSIETEC